MEWCWSHDTGLRDENLAPVCSAVLMLVSFSFKYPEFPGLLIKTIEQINIGHSPGGDGNIWHKWLKFLQNTDVLPNMKRL